MTINISKTQIASAVGLAFAGIMLAGGVNAGVIRNTNPTAGAFLGSCGPAWPARQACVGALDLGNVEVKIYNADGTENVGTPFDPNTGDYPLMGVADYFISLVKSGTTTVASLSGKVWPVGEPVAVKAVVGDMKTSKGKPNNCIINTAFLDEQGTAGVLSYLDSANPEPVICSSYFQSHKRFKIPMQAASLDPATPIDLVFNVVDESVWNDPNGLPGNTVTNPLNTNNLRPYQFFSKINNYTGKRLAGFKIIIGTGGANTGVPFQSASALGIESKLQLSLGKNEAAKDVTVMGVKTFSYNNEDIFDDGIATFSHGLFGAPDNNFPTNGFFDMRTAGFEAALGCDAEPAMTTKCQPYPNPYIPVDPAVPGGVLTDLKATDTIYSTTKLASNYNGPNVLPQPTAGLPFGDWLPFKWEPKGIFYDFDNDSTTDADLVAWWNGSQWLKNYDSGFAPATEAELVAWGTNPQYAVDIVEDTLNLGINFIMKIGDDIDGDGDPGTNPKITVRIIPIEAADQTPPAYVTNPPPALPTTPTTPTTPTPPPPVVSSSSGGGGGCTIGNDGRFDPTLPAMLFAGLGFLGWRRYKAGK